MKIRAKFGNGELLIYRDYWHQVLFQGGMGVFALLLGLAGVAVMFSQRAPEGYAPIAFVAVFVVAGLFLLLRLPKDAKKVRAGTASHVLQADATGVMLSPQWGLDGKRFAWGAISEIVLTERLETVEQGRRSRQSRVIVVFFVSDPTRNLSALGRATSPVGHSGAGRPCVLAQYPKDNRAMTEAALRRVAPVSVQIRSTDRAVFDEKNQRDSFV